MSINCRKVDFSESVNEFRDFVDSIRFKRGECGKHFKKHGEQLNGVGFEVGDNDSYLSKAQQCLIDTIFKRGFVFCSEDGEQLAFFMTLNQKKEPSYEGVLFNINEPMVSIGKIDDGTFRFHTFYIPNGKTPGLSLRHLS